MMISVIGTIAVNTGLIFVNHPWAYTIIRLLAGAFAHGGVIVGYVYVMEFVGPDSRAWACSHYLNIFSVRLSNCSFLIGRERPIIGINLKICFSWIRILVTSGVFFKRLALHANLDCWFVRAISDISLVPANNSTLALFQRAC